MARQTLKPPFAYYGGKITLAPKIAELLPPHEHYVEPFAGSLAVLLAKEPSPLETVNDLDEHLMTFWKVLRERPDELAEACYLTPHSRREPRQGFPADADDLEIARRVWLTIKQSRTNSLRAGGWRFGVHAESGKKIIASMRNSLSRLFDVAERIHNVSLEHGDALDVIRRYGSDPRVCMYVDPPYVGRSRAIGYRIEMGDDAAHIALADALNECSASILLSGFADPIYEQMFPGWHQVEMKAPRNLAHKSGPAEVLWMNFQPHARPAGARPTRAGDERTAS